MAAATVQELSGNRLVLGLGSGPPGLGSLDPASTSNLNALRYIWPAGFARFSLCAMNPNIGGVLAAKDVSALEDVLGCKLRQVYAHY